MRWEGDDEEWEEEKLGENRHGEHHLLTCKLPICGEYLVLGRVGQAVYQKAGQLALRIR